MGHICISKLTSNGSDNGLSPGRRQAIIWTNAGILLHGPWGSNFSGSFIEILTFPFKKMHLKVSSAKWRPCCLSLNVLSHQHPTRSHLVLAALDSATRCTSAFTCRSKSLISRFKVRKSRVNSLQQQMFTFKYIWVDWLINNDQWIVFTIDFD